MLVIKRYFKSIFCVIGAALLLVNASALAQSQSSGVSPVLKLRGGELNQGSVYKNFTTTLQHASRIKAVMDFDAQIVKVEPVQGHPDQVTVYALETGVTTVTIIDEFDQATKVEILVKGDVRHLETTLRQHFPSDSIEVTEIKGAVLLSGWVSRPERINQIVEIAEQFFPLVLNHMRIGGNQQVSLKATIMEVNRTKLRQMGMNFGLTRGDSFLLSTPGPITPLGGLTVSASAAEPTFTGLQNPSVTFGFMNPSSIFQGFVDALRTEGLLKIHATPMVTTANGSPAALLNGGEAPVLVPAGLGTTAIEFKPFGIILNAVPHLLGQGRVRLQVEPSVVERDFANSVTVDGVTVPSFTVRKVSTEVEMNMGQTLVIGGLVSKRNQTGSSKVPFFGELPYIGAAFSRKDYTEVETELVILVEPNYASALSAEEIPPGGPGMFTDTPTDIELFAHGLLEVPKVGDECSGATWNCQECNQNGFCQRHPNGRWSVGGGAGSGGFGSGSCGSGSCGQNGCTDCTPSYIQPMMITPQVGAGTGGDASLPPTIKQIPSISGGTAAGGTQQPVSFSRTQTAAKPGKMVQPTTTGSAAATQQEKRPSRSGLITPFLR